MDTEVVSIEEGEENLFPQVVKTESLHIKPMSVDEAVMQMDLLNNNFLVFTNAKTENLNVLYRRKDGNYGLIKPVT